MTRIESELRNLTAYRFGPPESVDAIRTRARRRRQRSRVTHATTLVVVVALAAGGVALLTRSDSSRSVFASGGAREAPPASAAATTPNAPDIGRWSVIAKATAGIDPRASIDAATSDGTVALVGGARPGGRTGRLATIWRSTDGFRWEVADAPSELDAVTALGIHGDVALAVVPRDRVRAKGTAAVWRSDDAGRTWTEAARGRAFGNPAPEMGRPYVHGLMWHDGWWIAYGARSDGYAGIWISRDGASWKEVLGPNQAGAIEQILVTRDGRLVASWGNQQWRSTNPRDWGRVAITETPKPYALDSVASGLDIAFAQSTDKHGQPTPLLRSRNDGRSWAVDASFLDAFPDARVLAIDAYGGRRVAAGSNGSTVSAWSSVDGITWSELPSAFRASSGGTLQYVLGVGDRIAILGSAPELDRYFVLDLASSEDRALRVPANAVDCVPRVVIDALNADGLPALENVITSEHQITGLASALADRIRARYPNVIDVGVGPGWGRAWTDQGGQIRVVPVDDYAIVATVGTAADCPTIPGYGAGIDGATVFFRHV